MLSSIVVALGFNAGLLLVSLGTGRICLRLIGVSGMGRLESGLLSVGLGYAVISYVLLAIGLGSALNVWTAWLVLGFAAAITAFQMPAIVSAVTKTAFSLRARHIPPWALVLVAVILAHATLNLIGALAPPSMADTLRHHLAAPKYYAAVGGFPFVPIIYWNAPGQLHVIYTLHLLVANDLAPAVTHYLFSILTAFAVFALARRYVNETAALIGAAVFYTLPMTTELSTAPMVEFGATFFVVVMVYSLMRAGESVDRRWVVLAGLFGGLAAATKIWALMAGPAAVVTLAAMNNPMILREPRRLILTLTLFSAAFGLALSPWLIRNYVASGDPLWPIGYEVFHGSYWTEWQVDKFAAWTAGPGTSISHFLLGPWNLTNNISSFVQSRGPLSSALLSPILIIFVPAVLLFRSGIDQRAMRLTAALLVFSLVVYFIWFEGYQQPRYLNTLHPLISLVAGVGAAAVLATRQRWLKAVASGALATSFVGTLGVAVAFNAGFAPVVFGTQAREAFLVDNVPHYGSLSWSNENLPADSKVLFVGLSGWYYLDRDWWPGASIYQGLIPFHQMKSPRELLQEMDAIGITHVLVQGDPRGDATIGDRLRRILGYVPSEEEYVERLKDEPASVSEFERRPILLLGSLESDGGLELLFVGRDSFVESRTFGGAKDVEFALYKVRTVEPTAHLE